MFSQLEIEDCFQNLELRLLLHHKPLEQDEGGEIVSEEFILSGELPLPKPEVIDEMVKAVEATGDDDDKIVIVEEHDAKRAKIAEDESTLVSSD